MLILLYNGGVKKTVDYVPELLKWFEQEHGDPTQPGGIVRKVVLWGKPIRIQYFVNWPNSPTSEKPVQDARPARTYRRASMVRVIHG